MTINLIIMGVQGSGKGTQAASLREAYGLIHVSTGDLFRALKTREDEFAKKIQVIMAAGNLVSDQDTNEVLKQHLDKTPHPGGIIFDGYPRNVEQSEWLEHYLAQHNEKLTAVLLMELDLYTAFKRTFGRVSTQDEKVSYNIYSNTGEIDYQFTKHEDNAFPPRLEATLKVTGEKLKRRPDDANAAAILKRMDDFVNTTTLLIPYYESKGLLVRIDASQSVETVSAKIKNAIESKRSK
ncbi:MAG TPA: nucleoside monophosphate kinase [Phototrophicaceae bacterium]|jgi:adenylate kinase|nr:nucleoside monophosphate kinase [Phototrophicaceae bacterium]